MFEAGKTYKTDRGGFLHITAVLENANYPLRGIHFDAKGTLTFEAFTAEGTFFDEESMRYEAPESQRTLLKPAIAEVSAANLQKFLRGEA